MALKLVNIAIQNTHIIEFIIGLRCKNANLSLNYYYVDFITSIQATAQNG